MNIIEIHDLVVTYSKRQVLNGLSLSVPKGSLFGFLGPNGSGKSTTIKTLLGMVESTSGSVRLNGLSPSNPEARKSVGYLPEEALYYRYLTPVETLRFYGELFSLPKSVLNSRIDKLLDLVGLSAVKNKPIRTFSKGMTQKVSLAQALINDPETLILDEPMSGLDPLARMDLRQLLLDLKAQGKTILFSSHELSEVELVCDSIAIIKAGRLIKEGTLNDILGSHHEKNIERFFRETIQGDKA